MLGVPVGAGVRPYVRGVEDAFLVSVLIGLSVSLMALPGGLVWLTLRAARPGGASAQREGVG